MFLAEVVCVNGDLMNILDACVFNSRQTVTQAFWSFVN